MENAKIDRTSTVVEPVDQEALEFRRHFDGSQDTAAGIDSDSLRLVVNGRFRSKAITGVQRHACEVLRRLPHPFTEIQSESWSSGVSGHFWEQFQLRRRIPKSTVLWSPSNTGPLGVSNQVVTLHDLAFLDRPEDFSRSFAAWYRWMIPRLAKQCSRIMTVSEFSKQRICDELGIDDDKVRVVYNGVSPNFEPVDPSQVDIVQRRLGLNASYIVALGSLQPRKNLSVLIEAWQRIADQYPETQLAIIGEGQKFYRQVNVSPANEESVVFLGRLPDEDLPPVLSGASAFVYPSLYEGFGIPPLEAMACDCPVICSNATSLPEVVGDAALLFDPTDVDGLVDHLRTILDDPEKALDLVEKGRRRVERFNWGRVTRDVLSTLVDAAQLTS